MGTFIYFTEEQKRQANEVDLDEFLRRQGDKLLPSGRDYRLDSDHSVTIRGSEWFDHETALRNDLPGGGDDAPGRGAGTVLSAGKGENPAVFQNVCAASPQPGYAPGVRLPDEAPSY